MKPQTVQIVLQGEATPYWFKVNPLYRSVFSIRKKFRPMSEGSRLCVF